jgi:hypothetical protein
VANASKVLMSSGDAPDTPDTGKIALYAKADGIFYYKADDGVEHAMDSSVSEQIGAVGLSFEATAKPAAAGSYDFILPYAMTIPEDCADSGFYNKTNPSAEVVVEVKKNGTEFATLTVSSGGSPTWAATETELAAGDRVSFVFPAQDSTWAGVVITLRGVKS